MRVGASVGPRVDEISDISAEFDFVEIAMVEMEIDPDEIDREKLKEDLESSNLELLVHFPFRQPLVTGVEELDQANMEYIERLMSISKDLGAEKVIIHVNNRYGLKQEKRHEDKLIEIMNRLYELGKRRGLEVTFENVPEKASPALEMKELGQIAQEEDLSICFDLGHAYAQEGQEGIEEFLDNFMDNISHLHVQDSMRGEDSHVAVGHGDIDWESTGKKLSDFNGTATIEVFTSDREYQKVSREKFLESVE